MNPREIPENGYWALSRHQFFAKVRFALMLLKSRKLSGSENLSEDRFFVFWDDEGFQGADRQQTTLLPECLDDWVDEMFIVPFPRQWPET